jgi:hypothetical protein
MFGVRYRLWIAARRLRAVRKDRRQNRIAEKLRYSSLRWKFSFAEMQMSSSVHGGTGLPANNDGGDGIRRTLTRQEHYDLVWATPMVHLAKKFGLSDVGLRKICTKHKIPTPPLGYWAKLAHGKPVHQPALEPIDEDAVGADKIVLRVGPIAPAHVAVAQEEALAQLSGHSPIVVPSERPAHFHPVAAATAKALRSAKTDQEGFKCSSSPSGANVSVGRDSIKRTVCIVDAIARAADERGFVFEDHDEGVRIVVDDIPIAWRIYAIKDRSPHEPTKQELTAQARHEEDRARWPTLYSSRSDTRVYRSWDYFASDRLALTFTDTTRWGWGRDRQVGHWHDRKSKKLEQYLDDALAALVTGTVAIKHRLAEEAEKERRRAEERERLRREQARRERAMKRHEYILKKADDFSRYEKLVAFAEYMERHAYRYGDEPVDRLVDEMRSLVAVMRDSFERESLEAEIERLQLYSEDDDNAGEPSSP